MRHCLTWRTIEYWTLSENSAFLKNPVPEIERWIGQIKSEPRTNMDDWSSTTKQHAGFIWVDQPEEIMQPDSKLPRVANRRKIVAEQKDDTELASQRRHWEKRWSVFGLGNCVASQRFLWHKSTFQAHACISFTVELAEWMGIRTSVGCRSFATRNVNEIFKTVRMSCLRLQMGKGDGKRFWSNYTTTTTTISGEKQFECVVWADCVLQCHERVECFFILVQTMKSRFYVFTIMFWWRCQLNNSLWFLETGSLVGVLVLFLLRHHNCGWNTSSTRHSELTLRFQSRKQRRGKNRLLFQTATLCWVEIDKEHSKEQSSFLENEWTVEYGQHSCRPKSLLGVWCKGNCGPVLSIWEVFTNLDCCDGKRVSHAEILGSVLWNVLFVSWFYWIFWSFITLQVAACWGHVTPPGDLKYSFCPTRHRMTELHWCGLWQKQHQSLVFGLSCSRAACSLVYLVLAAGVFAWCFDQRKSPCDKCFKAVAENPSVRT